jgi:hypothetical protein
VAQTLSSVYCKGLNPRSVSGIFTAKLCVTLYNGKSLALIRKHKLLTASLFGRARCGEQMLSFIKTVKSESYLTDEQLEGCMRNTKKKS